MGGENAQHRFSPGLETQLIPAHAGKTVAVQSTAPPCAAHPRSRGENEMSDQVREVAAGSSPLTRGKHEAWAFDAEAGRLIPAHAGKTSPSPTQRKSSWAHPRSRGENTRRGLSTPKPAGSSPLTRGKPRRPLLNGNRAGLIPAHAGKTGHCQVGLPEPAAHPRSRGENRKP